MGAQTSLSFYLNQLGSMHFHVNPANSCTDVTVKIGRANKRGNIFIALSDNFLFMPLIFRISCSRNTVTTECDWHCPNWRHVVIVILNHVDEKNENKAKLLRIINQKASRIARLELIPMGLEH